MIDHNSTITEVFSLVEDQKAGLGELKYKNDADEFTAYAVFCLDPVYAIAIEQFVEVLTGQFGGKDLDGEGVLKEDSE